MTSDVGTHCPVPSICIKYSIVLKIDEVMKFIVNTIILV